MEYNNEEFCGFLAIPSRASDFWWSMNKQICIFGAGGFAREVFCLIADLEREGEVAGFLEADHAWRAHELLGIPVLPESVFDPAKHTAVLAVGDPGLRERIARGLPRDTEFETLIHPSVVASRWIEIGEGAVICAGTVLTCDIRLGRHVHLNLRTTVGHDVVTGDFVTVSPGSNISGKVTLGHRVFLGSGACIRQEITLGDDIVIGMGGVVVTDLHEAGTYVGNPVRKIG